MMDATSKVGTRKSLRSIHATVMHVRLSPLGVWGRAGEVGGCRETVMKGGGTDGRTDERSYEETAPKQSTRIREF